MTKNNSLHLIIEGALMASHEPLTLQEIANLFEDDKPSKNDIKKVIDDLNNNYKNHSFEISLVASGYRIQVKSGYDKWLSKLNKQTSTRYSKAFLETLVIIAYKQPVTRGDIEDIRGVSVSGTITKTLLEREWIKVVGHRDVPGRPELLATTKSFLDYFNLKKLSELPPLEDIKDFDAINPDLFEALEKDKSQSNKSSQIDSSSDDLSSTNATPEDTNSDTVESAKVIPFSN